MHDNTVNDRIYLKAFVDRVVDPISCCSGFGCCLSRFCFQIILQKCLLYWLFSNFMSMPCNSMREKLFSSIVSVLSTFPFTFVYIPRYVTHSVQRAPVNIIHTSVLICKAETSVLVNEITVLSCSITVFSF